MIKRGTNGKFIFLSEDDSHDFLSFMFANSHDLGDRSDYYIICGEIDESYTIELANKYKLYSENSIMEFTRILSAKILTRDNDSQSIVEYSH